MEKYGDGVFWKLSWHFADCNVEGQYGGAGCAAEASQHSYWESAETCVVEVAAEPVAAGICLSFTFILLAFPWSCVYLSILLCNCLLLLQEGGSIF